MKKDKFKIVISEEEIQNRVKELGEEITRDYANKEPIVICMLKGAVMFFGDLIKRIDTDINLEFARISSYGNGTESGALKVVSDINCDISGRHVIIVEDIVDSGKTLDYYVRKLREKNPASVEICAFIDKPQRREAEVSVKYCGFKGEFGFVIGYGMDYAQKFRQLPFLAEINSPDDLADLT